MVKTWRRSSIFKILKFYSNLLEENHRNQKNWTWFSKHLYRKQDLALNWLSPKVYFVNEIVHKMWTQNTRLKVCWVKQNWFNSRTSFNKLDYVNCWVELKGLRQSCCNKRIRCTRWSCDKYNECITGAQWVI